MSAQRHGTRFDSTAIADVTGGRVLRPGPPGPINANNLTMEAGEWFIALRGDGFDDHPFLPEAERRGAAGVILEREVEGLRGPAVLVSHAWGAIGDLALAARRGFPGPVVAVTGSTGKTTTCVLIRNALSPLGPVHPEADHVNAMPSVSLALLACPGDVAAQVLELGASKPGRMAEMARVVSPNVRVVVSIGPAHLEHFGNVHGVAREKAELIRSAGPGDVVILNVGDPCVASLEVPPGADRITYGPSGDFALIRADVVGEGLHAHWSTPAGDVTAILPSPARFVAENAAAALAVAWSQGIAPADAAHAMESYQPLGPRLRAMRASCGAVVLNDAFNANPYSMAEALRVLATRPGRHLAVLGDMAELGPQSGEYHAQIVALALELGVAELVLVGPQMASVAPPKAVVVGDATEAADALRAVLRPGDVVLVKASRVMALDRVADLLEAPEQGE